MAIDRSTEEFAAIDLNASTEDKLKTRSLPLSLASLASGFAQSACVWLMAGNSAKSLLGVGSVTVAGGSSFLHSEPIRSFLMLVTVFTALLVLFVVWNGHRLRIQPASRWRYRPLSRREKASITFSVGSSLFSLLLVLAEVWAHGILHPRH